MSLNSSQVQEIAHLARLAIDDAEVPAYSRDLSAILDFVEQLSSVDTQGVTPLAHPLEMAQRLRADDVTELDQRALFQSIAPATEAGLYLVPRVIE